MSTWDSTVAHEQKLLGTNATRIYCGGRTEDSKVISKTSNMLQIGNDQEHQDKTIRSW